MANIVDQGNIREAALHNAIRSIRRMSAGKRFQVEEWKIFFQQDGILEIISREEFLRALGDCFTSKAIKDDLYQVLEEQLGMAESYLHDRQIDLTNNAGSDPISYARSKIESANDLYRIKKERKIYSAIFGILLLIHLIVTRTY